MAWRPNVERAVAQVATWRGRRLKLRYRGVAKNHAWLKRRTAALNLRNLIGQGLARQDGSWVLATGPGGQVSPSQPARRTSRPPGPAPPAAGPRKRHSPAGARTPQNSTMTRHRPSQEPAQFSRLLGGVMNTTATGRDTALAL